MAALGLSCGMWDLGVRAPECMGTVVVAGRFSCPTLHAGSLIPDQGSNSRSLHLNADS